MPRIYTEIRIFHKSPEKKAQYENVMDEALKQLGYKSRAEWIDVVLGDTIKKAQKGGKINLTGMIRGV
jgi:metal-responsive CopG/Arc/MetJ family transcriptional regulator